MIGEKVDTVRNRKENIEIDFFYDWGKMDTVWNRKENIEIECFFFKFKRTFSSEKMYSSFRGLTPKWFS